MPRARRARGGSPRSRRSPATSADEATAATGRRRAAGLDAARQQRQPPRPEPAAGASPTIRSTALEQVYRVNVFAPLRLTQLALPLLGRRAGGSSTSPPTPPSSPTRAGAATAPRRRRSSSSPRCSAAEQPGAARLRRRPRRHAHADAPGGLPRRGHLRPAAARGERARPVCVLVDGRAAERPLPRARAGAGSRRERPRRHSPSPPRPSRPPEARGRARRRAPAGRGAGTGPATPLRRARRPARARRRARREHVRHAPRRAPGAARAARRLRSTSRPRSPGARAPLGRRAPPRRGSARPTARAGRDAALAARRRPAGCSAAVPWAAALDRGPRRSPGRCSTTSARHGRADPLRPRRRRWPLDAYQTVFAHRAGQRRDAERRPPVHARARDRGSVAAASTSRRSCSTPVCPRSRRRGALPRALSRTRLDRRPGQRRATARRPGDRGRHDRRPRARVAADARRHRRAGGGWTDLVIGPTRRAGGRRPPDRLPRPRLVPPQVLEAVAGPALVERRSRRRERRLPAPRVRRRAAARTLSLDPPDWRGFPRPEAEPRGRGRTERG